MLVPGGPSEKSSTFAEDFELSGSRLRLKIRVWALGVRTFETQREVLTRFPWLLVKAGIRRDTRIYIYIYGSPMDCLGVVLPGFRNQQIQVNDLVKTC